MSIATLTFSAAFDIGEKTEIFETLLYFRRNIFDSAMTKK